MKIMIVAPYFAPAVGGLENYALNIAKGLQKKGDEVFVVTANHIDKKYREDSVEGLRVIRLPISFKFSNTPLGISWYRQLKNITLREKPDVINAHSPVPGLADIAVCVGSRYNIPTNLTYHAASLKKSGSLIFNIIERLYALAQKSTFNKATRIIAVSDFVKECLSASYQAKTSVIPNAINPSDIPKKDIPRKSNRFIFIGNLHTTHAWKGLDDIIEAVSYASKTNPKIELIVVGDGTRRSYYEQKVKALKIEKSIIFKGALQGEEKYDLLRSATALIAYPTTENDAFPTVFPEAWACGTPVIGAKIGALTSLLQQAPHSVLTEPKNPKALSNALLEFKKLSTTKTQDIVEYSKNFSWKVVVDSTRELFKYSMLPKVCIIHNIISPYRLPVFEELGKSVQLTLVFCKSITNDRKWTFNLDSYTFSRIILNGVTKGPFILNRGVYKVVKSLNPDVIAINTDPDVATATLPAFIYAKLRGKKVITWSQSVDDEVHSLESIRYGGTIQRFIYNSAKITIKAYRAIYFKFADSYVSIGKAATDHLRSKNIREELIHSSMNIMPKSLLPVSPKKIKRNGKRFLYLGYLNYRKGVDYLIDGFMQIKDPDAELYIVGTGAAESQLKQRAKKDRRIKFRGYMEGLEKAEMFQLCDVFVFPTLNDVWGLVVNEAIYYGQAVITTDAAGAFEIVDSKTGRLVPYKDSDALRDSMVFYLENPAKLQNSCKYNIKRKDAVSDPNIFSRAIYDSVKTAINSSAST